MLRSFSLAILLVLAAAGTTAQDTIARKYPEVTFNALVRYRPEVDGRFFNFNARPLFLHLLKSQLGARVQLTRDINIGIRLQDSRNFGEENGALGRGTLDGNAQSIGLREAYAHWNNFLVDSLDLSLGRMIFQTNNERLIGALEWNNVGRSYDGASLQYRFGPSFSARAFAFRLGTNELLQTTASKQDPQGLRGVEINLPWQDKLNAYWYNDVNTKGIASGVDVGKNSLERSTIGIYVKNVIDDLSYEFELAHQRGVRKTTDSTARADIIASLVTSIVSYRITSDVVVGAGFDYFSGDDVTTTNVNEGFDHLFSTTHKFYGYMDFFPVTLVPSSGQRVPIAGQQSGLLMPHILSTFQLTTAFSAQTRIMMYRANTDVPGTTAKDFGYEIDLNAYYTVSKNVRMEAGLSTFLPGNALTQTNTSRRMGSDPAYWAYTMFTFIL